LVAVFVTAALLFAIDAYRPAGAVRILSVLVVFVAAPAYLAFGFAAFAWAEAMAFSSAIWSASVANGLLYGAGALALFTPAAWPQRKRVLLFLAVIWGLPVLAMSVAAAVS